MFQFNEAGLIRVFKHFVDTGGRAHCRGGTASLFAVLGGVLERASWQVDLALIGLRFGGVLQQLPSQPLPSCRPCRRARVGGDRR